MINLFDHPLSLHDVSLRHRRNLIVASTIVGIIALTPGVDPADIKIFGLSFAETPSVWIWSGSIAFVAYFLITYAMDIHLIYKAWSFRVMPIFFNSMKIFFGFRDDVVNNGKAQIVRGGIADISIEEVRDAKDLDDALDQLKGLYIGPNVSLVSAHYAQDVDGHGNDKGDPYTVARVYKSSLDTTNAHSVIFPRSYLNSYRWHIVLSFLWQVLLPLGGGLAVIILCVSQLNPPEPETLELAQPQVQEQPMKVAPQRPQVVPEKMPENAIEKSEGVTNGGES